MLESAGQGPVMTVNNFGDPLWWVIRVAWATAIVGIIGTIVWLALSGGSNAVAWIIMIFSLGLLGVLIWEAVTPKIIPPRA